MSASRRFRLAMRPARKRRARARRPAAANAPAPLAPRSAPDRTARAPSPAGKPTAILLTIALHALVPAAAFAQPAPSGRAVVPMPAAPTGEGVPWHRTIAGTAWQPDLAPLDAFHAAVGVWSLMVHGVARLAYVREAAPKAGARLGGTNWLMAAAARPAAGGTLTLTAMGSAERWTLGACGLPRVLGVSGECDTDGYRDYQHAHPPVMELSARYGWPLAGAVAVELFAALASQPALGPPGYAHRVSAADPLAPISEHELDAAHVSAGVLTAGVHATRWKLEASLFDGEPVGDDVVLEPPGPLRSFAARASFNPGARWSAQASASRIEAGAGHHPGAAAVLRVATASATHVRPLGTASSVAATLAWAYMEDGILPRHGLLLEAALRAGARHTVYGRAEVADRAEARTTIVEHPDGTHDHFVDAHRRRVGGVSAGYRFDHTLGRAALGLGARVGVTLLPESFAVIYRARHPLGFAIYGAVRPASPATPAGHAHGTGTH